VITD